MAVCRVKFYRGLFRREESDGGLKLAIHLHVVLMLRMSGALHVLPPTHTPLQIYIYFLPRKRQADLIRMTKFEYLKHRKNFCSPTSVSAKLSRFFGRPEFPMFVIMNNESHRSRNYVYVTQFLA
jgi:hypothetical protein